MMPRSRACPRISLRSSTSRGSLLNVSVMRRSQRPVGLCSSGIRVGISQLLKNPDLDRLHASRVPIVFVIVPQKVQDAVYDHVRPVRPGLLPLLPRFARDDGGADGEVAQGNGWGLGAGGWRIGRK